MRHKLTEREESKGGKDSHEHHKKAHDMHMREAKKHAHALHKMADRHHKMEDHSITGHDRVVDRRNLSHARSARGK